MSNKTRRTFTQDFKLKSALLVLDQGYLIREAAIAMNVGNPPWINGSNNSNKS